MNTTTDATLTIIFTNSHQEDLFSASSSLTIEQQSNDGVQNVRHESASTLPMVITQASIDEMNAPTPSFFLPMNVYDDVMAEPSNDNNTCQQDQPRKKHKTVETTLEEESLTQLLQLEQLISLDEILGQVEGESTQLLRSSTSTAGEGSSTELAQEQGGNMGVFSAQKTVQILVLKTLCRHGRLRYRWSSRLDIALFLPQKAVSHTMDTVFVEPL